MSVKKVIHRGWNQPGRERYVIRKTRGEESPKPVEMKAPIVLLLTMTQSLGIFIVVFLMIVFILLKATKNRDYVDIVNFWL